MEAVRLTRVGSGVECSRAKLKAKRSRTRSTIAKYWAAEGGQWNAYACQHLHGGIGIDVDYPLHRYFIWSTQLEHSLGSATRAAGLGWEHASPGAASLRPFEKVCRRALSGPFSTPLLNRTPLSGPL